MSSAADPADLERFRELLGRIAANDELDGIGTRAHRLFDFRADIHVSRAPGRLDVMGGIADYSGAHVLQMPIAEATFCAFQLRPPPCATISVVSAGAPSSQREPLFEIATAELYDENGAARPLSSLRAMFAADPSTAWAAYAVGTLAVIARELGARVVGGAALFIASDVPEGKGVSSSAAIEVAAMCAALGALGVAVDPPSRLALLCQMVENEVVGAPCGVMDQMASALGERSALLSLTCRPATVNGIVPIPPHVRLWGIDSGVRHAVGEEAGPEQATYGTVRTAAFMGRAILRAALGGARSIDHLCELTPSELAGDLGAMLPTSARGDEFLRAHGSHGDATTTVDPTREYAVAACTRHPINEQFRVDAFESVLRSPPSRSQLPLLGELMYQSHASYSSVGLGSAATDAIVQLVREAGPASHLYGAKITGGGSGGTVCIIGEACDEAEAAVARLLAEYTRRTGREPYVVTGSSIGAVEFGVRRVRVLG